MNLHVKLFDAGSPVPIPKWFTASRSAKLISKSRVRLPNFTSHMKCESEKQDPALEELGKLRFTNSKPVYLANFIIYALMLRYSSLWAYKLLLTEFNIPSISFLRKWHLVNWTLLLLPKSFKDSGYWCSMKYICKSPRNSSGGETIGTDETGDLYKVLMWFMIVGLKSNIPFVVRVVPETGLRWVASRRY